VVHGADAIGEYDPDWAIVLDREGSGERGFPERETKDDGEMRPTELMKTECDMAHFQGAFDVGLRGRRPPHQVH
jgi:hypothetical protein